MTNPAEPLPITPDTKDWTWVLREPCADCGLEAAALDPAGFGDLLRDNADQWSRVLGRSDVRSRPASDVWSPLEYAAHVRDVHRTFGERVRLMLEEDGPTFANWDQDVAAVDGHYDRLDPVIVAVELTAAAAVVAGRYDAVPDDAWERTGTRSNGSEFTVRTIGQYHLHDVVHHLHDVGITAS